MKGGFVPKPGFLCGYVTNEQVKACLPSPQNMACERGFKHGEVSSKASGPKRTSFAHSVEHGKRSAHSQDNRVESQMMNILGSKSSTTPA